jgi:hypothetical protein
MMRYVPAASAMFCLIFLDAKGLAHNVQAVSRRTTTQKLEDMRYTLARRIILGYGWTPLLGPCEGQVDTGTCAHYPEIGNCSGVFPGYCDMNFVEKNRCLYVLTIGGQPPVGDESSDARIERITFQHGPCIKNPTH